MKVIAANDNLILVETDHEIKTTPGGIVFKDCTQDDLVVGKLVSKGKKAGPSFIVDELLLFEKCNAVEYYDGETTHFIICEDNILAKLEA